MSVGSRKRFFIRACPSCGRRERGTICCDTKCDRRFVPQPGYSPRHCPLHDPELLRPEVPADFRIYKLDRARRCARCGEEIFRAS